MEQKTENKKQIKLNVRDVIQIRDHVYGIRKIINLHRLLKDHPASIQCSSYFLESLEEAFDFGNKELWNEFPCTSNGLFYHKPVGVQLWQDGPFWASENIGANDPSDIGYYFWWGDTVGYKKINGHWVGSNGVDLDFHFSPDRAVVFGYSFGKYEDGEKITINSDSSILEREDVVQTDGNLCNKHDAACAHWRNNWRMPTQNDFIKLIEKTTCQYILLNGVQGITFTGKKNFSSNSIFLPLPECSVEENQKDFEENPLLAWSSTLSPQGSFESSALGCTANSLQLFSKARHIGLPIRPVFGCPSRI